MLSTKDFLTEDMVSQEFGYSGNQEIYELWRFYGLGDLKRPPVPPVNLRCDVEFQNFEEVVTFLKAANDLAADTADGNVTFNKLSFEEDDVDHLFFGELDRGRSWCFTRQTEVLFEGRLIEVEFDSHRQEESPDPFISIAVYNDTLPQNPLICCSSLLLPELRMLSSQWNTYYVHDLDATSPSTEVVRTSMPLPMFFCVRGFHSRKP
eukprot:s2746_g9.t1